MESARNPDPSLEAAVNERGFHLHGITNSTESQNLHRIKKSIELPNLHGNTNSFIYVIEVTKKKRGEKSDRSH